MSSFDVGNTSDSLVEQLIASISDSKYLEARAIYQNLASLERDDKLEANVKAKLVQLQPQVKTLLERAERVDNTLLTWETESNASDWIFGTDYYGVVTHYKTTENGIITIRMEASKDDQPIFEQIAVMHEIDLFKDWVPFCTKSELIKKIGFAEIFAYFKLSIPFCSRDTLFNAFGVDCLEEHGLFMLLGESSIEGDGSELLERKSWFHNRIDVLDFKFIARINSPVSTNMILIATIEPNAPLPKMIVNFIIRNIAGLILYLLQQQAQKIIDDPSSIYRVRIKEKNEFYRDWVLRKLL
jgi:hypothetical protein